MSKTPGIIRKLDEVVVNRIAAGEVIQRPANALKELLENCLDAGARNIQVLVKAGGMKLLQIQDDGCGIRKEDLPIVCERFTTSKLEKFEDLLSIGTYGFRGEALASISHVAHLTILTKTEGSPCAYRAEYSNGKLLDIPSNPKACAGNQGTTIIVEDVFYNMEARRKALKNSSEEHGRVLEVVAKYSIHNSKVGFLMKKYGESNIDLKTQPNSTVLDNIKVIYGSQVARELIPVSCEDDNFRMNGYVSNGNYSVKKSSFIIFINNRLVNSTGLKKALDSVYATYLPKGSHPFVYISLELDPKNVDVNVHPTKHEVHFLHEDFIAAEIGCSIDKTLQGSNQSRTFYIQSLLPGAGLLNKSLDSSNCESRKRKNQPMDIDFYGPHPSHKDKPSTSTSFAAPKYHVRTDPKEQTLDKFLATAAASVANKNNSVAGSEIEKNVDETANHSQAPSSTSRRRRIYKLTSVNRLRENLNAVCHMELMTALRNHTFVGCVDRTKALIQYDTKLYMINTVVLSKELFYQKMVLGFGNISNFKFNDSISLRKLIGIALKNAASQNVDEATDEIVTLLQSKAPMLEEYFSLLIDATGQLQGIPLLLDNYIPSLELIPDYLLNIARHVNWEIEQECFETFCQETAQFYAVPPGTEEDNDKKLHTGKTWKWTIEHVIYPEIKKSLQPPKKLAEDSSVIELTNLPKLYKVFERC